MLEYHSISVLHIGGDQSEIAQRIRDFGQQELSRRSGVPQATISEWLRGINGMELDKLQRILSVLNGSIRRPQSPRVRWS